MKTIELTKGYVALVDDEDFDRVSQYSWNAHVCRRKDKSINKVYASGRDEKRVARLLHRFILGIADPKIEVDHVDGNGLNCQRYNLRVCTTQQNRQYKGKRGKSEFKGISFHSLTGKWRARIFVNGREISLGLFTGPLEAACAYDMAAVKHFGEFALCNFAKP